MRLLAVLAGIGLCASAAADPASKERADKLFEDGRRYLGQREYALACTAFEQSQQADPAIGTQLNIALCYEQWGKTASAYRAYVEAERLARLKFDNRATGARKKVDELAPKAPRLRFELPAGADASVVILFDGKELAIEKLGDELLVDPGAHELEARVPGTPAKKTPIDIKDGERRTIAIDVPAAPLRELPPPPRRTGRLYGGIAMISLGTVAIGVGTVVALGARSDYNDAVALCPQFRCPTREAFDATQDARSRANYMTIVVAGGAVIAGAGLYMVLTSRGTRVQPIVRGDQVGLAIGGDL